MRNSKSTDRQEELVNANLARGDEKYRFLFEQAAEFILIHNMEGRIVDVNDSLCKRLGYGRDEMLRMKMEELIDPFELRQRPLRMKELSEGKCIFSERSYRCKDGSTVEIEANVKKMSDDMVVGVCRDVTERKKIEFELREAEHKFRTISEKSLVGIYIYQDDRFVYVNPKFAEIFGYTPQELVNCLSVDDLVHEDDRARVREYLRERLTGQIESIHYEAKGVKNDGSCIFAEVFGNRSMYRGRAAIMGTLIDITERKEAEDQIIRERNQKKLMEEEILNQKVQEQKKITRALLKGQEKERNKIGQELHDNVNQILASTRMYLSIVLNRKSMQRALIEDSAELIDNAIQEIRLLSKNQITPQVKLSLRELIQLLVDSLNETAPVKTTFVYAITGHSVNAELKLNIYRIIQEQINNILKHARATEVHIELKSEGRMLRVLVSDNGRGFHPQKKRKGIGMTNITNRVESFNGQLSVESKPGEGCRLSILLPLH